MLMNEINYDVGFEEFWKDTKYSDSQVREKDVAWEFWCAANKRVYNSLRYIKGITEHCQGYNEAISDIEKMVKR